MIRLRALTKRYGEKTAVSDLTFSVRPGIVTLGTGQRLGLAGPCSAIRPPSSSTNRSTAWTPRASGGSATC